MTYVCEQYGLTPKGLIALRHIVRAPMSIHDGQDYRVLHPLRKKGLVDLHAVKSTSPFPREYPSYWIVTHSGYDLFMALEGVDPYQQVEPTHRKVVALRPRLRLISGDGT